MPIPVLLSLFVYAMDDQPKLTLRALINSLVGRSVSSKLPAM